MALLPITFDGDFILEPCDDDLPVPDFRGAVHGDEISIQDPGVAHAHALNAEQEVRRLLEQIGINLITRFDVLLCQDRLTCCDSTNQWQSQLLTHRIFEPYSA